MHCEMSLERSRSLGRLVWRGQVSLFRLVKRDTCLVRSRKPREIFVDRSSESLDMSGEEIKPRYTCLERSSKLGETCVER